MGLRRRGPRRGLEGRELEPVRVDRGLEVVARGPWIAERPAALSWSDDALECVPITRKR